MRPLLKRNARKDIQLPVATGCAGLQRYLSLAQAVDMISIINEHQHRLQPYADVDRIEFVTFATINVFYSASAGFRSLY